MARTLSPRALAEPTPGIPGFHRSHRRGTRGSGRRGCHGYGQRRRPMPFLDVRVIRSTAPAPLCRIGDRSVWFPRRHISGKLWGTGDRGKRFIRRWLARDRQLIDRHG
jgi:hypothetical protein